MKTFLRAKNIQFKRTTLIAVFCVAVLCGLGLSRLGLYMSLVWPVAMVIVSVPALLKKNLLALLLVITLGACFGLWRGSNYMQKLTDYNHLIGQPMTISGTATGDAVYSDTSQLTFDMSSLEIMPSGKKLVGTIQIEGRGEPMVYKGDRVLVSGKLYKKRGFKQAGMSFADMKIIGGGGSWADTMRRKFTAGAQSALPEPQASFGLGLLIGQRSLLPKDVSDKLAAAGLTHLVAVSGYNLTILIDAMRRLLGKRSKYQTTVAALSLMLFFVLCTGWSASIVRATIVSLLSLWAWYYGRTVKPFVLIAFTAALTAMWNPIYLWSDVGWYLSFLAFFGVLVIAPLLASYMARAGRQPGTILSLLCESFAAQIMTIPTIMYIFGRVSVVGLLANMVVVPFVPISMFLTLVAGIAGMTIPFFAGWLAWPARIMLTFSLDTAGIFSGFRHATIKQAVSWQIMLAMYLAIGCITVLMWFKRRPQSVIMPEEEGAFDVRTFQMVND